MTFVALAVASDELQRSQTAGPSTASNAVALEVVFVDGKEHSPFLDYWYGVLRVCAFTSPSLPSLI